MGHADFSVRERPIESPAAIKQKHLHRRAAAPTMFIFWQTGWQANQLMYFLGTSEIGTGGTYSQLCTNASGKDSGRASGSCREHLCRGPRFSWCECSKIPAADRGSSDDRLNSIRLSADFLQ